MEFLTVVKDVLVRSDDVGEEDVVAAEASPQQSGQAGAKLAKAACRRKNKSKDLSFALKLKK